MLLWRCPVAVSCPGRTHRSVCPELPLGGRQWPEDWQECAGGALWAQLVGLPRQTAVGVF